jgi:hypothetical protein
MGRGAKARAKFRTFKDSFEIGMKLRLAQTPAAPHPTSRFIFQVNRTPATSNVSPPYEGHSQRNLTDIVGNLQFYICHGLSPVGAACPRSGNVARLTDRINSFKQRWVDNEKVKLVEKGG